MKIDRHASATGVAWFGGILALVVAGVVVLASIVGSLAPTAPPAETAEAQVDVDGVYDPVKAGEDLPDGYRQGLNRDQIEPVYDPVFTTADEVDWPSEMLVIGVAGSTDAKAYPVTHLNQREMVIDSLEGIPILVTW
jgi:hypothetical protein